MVDVEQTSSLVGSWDSVMSLEPDTDPEERFDPFKGYGDLIQKGYSGDSFAWFALVPNATLARNALYQGFITEWEHVMIVRGYGTFTSYGTLKWLMDLPQKRKGPYPEEILTRHRIEMIRANHMLGIGDGECSF